MAEDLAYLSATRLLELYRAKELSPVAVVRETWPGLNATRAR